MTARLLGGLSCIHLQYSQINECFSLQDLACQPSVLSPEVEMTAQPEREYSVPPVPLSGFDRLGRLLPPNDGPVPAPAPRYFLDASIPNISLPSGCHAASVAERVRAIFKMK